ncbi:DUF421 domain-containing protein [Tabrizicola piscis]|nr:YetF domain-containing protein [Tabrizicola piscis]
MDQIIPFDPERMIWGSAPALIYLEIAVRVGVIWIWTIVLLRWVGGRSISQMSVVEFLLVIALGSAVGDPMFQADVPLLYGMLTILLVVLADKAVDHAFRYWTTAKRLVDGRPTEILREGHLSHAGLDKKGIGPTEVMEMLRRAGVRNLGQVEYAYMEPSGTVSTFLYDQPRPGLTIVPPLELRRLPAPDALSGACCTSCGLVRATADGTCAECGATEVTRAERLESREISSA